MIFSVKSTTLEVGKEPEKFRLDWESNPAVCDLTEPNALSIELIKPTGISKPLWVRIIPHGGNDMKWILFWTADKDMKVNMIFVVELISGWKRT